MERLRVAIGEQLKRCPQVITLGVRPQLADYTARERELLRKADIIFYPTARFVDIFATLGQRTFPSVNCYRLLGDKLKQTILFRLLDVPHPRTRIYYGYRQKGDISRDFIFPLVAKRHLNSSRGRHVFLIRNQRRLEWYNRNFNPAYIQEYVVADRELRVVVFNYREVFGYWRKAVWDDFRCNLSQGEILQREEVPREAAGMARHIARTADLSQMSVDIMLANNQFWVIDLNFQLGGRDWRRAGLDQREALIELIERGEL